MTDNDMIRRGDAIAALIGALPGSILVCDADRIHDAIAALPAVQPAPDVLELVEALRLARNRLQRLTVDFETGTEPFIRAGGWADDASAALAKWEASHD